MGANMGWLCGRDKKSELHGSSNDGGIGDTIPTSGGVIDDGRALE